MLRAKHIWVVGGDPRQAALARLLAPTTDTRYIPLPWSGERGCGASPAWRALLWRTVSSCPCPPWEKGDGSTPLCAGIRPGWRRCWMSWFPANCYVPAWCQPSFEPWRRSGDCSSGIILPGRSWPSSTPCPRRREPSRSPWRSCPSHSMKHGCWWWASAGWGGHWLPGSRLWGPGSRWLPAV